LAVIISAFGFGSLLSRWFPESFPRLTRVVCALIGGFGVLGLTLFLVGWHKYNRLTISMVLAVGIALAIRSLLAGWEFYLPIAELPAAIVAIVLIATAVAGLAEPVGDWNIDTVAYHLVGPKVWLRNGIVRPIPENMNTSYPSTVEMVFGSLYAFGGDRAPGFSAAWTLGLLLAVAASLGRRCGLNRSERGGSQH
jgi:hypothetical protein